MAILPDFIPIAINSNCFGMTRVKSPGNPAFRVIFNRAFTMGQQIGQPDPAELHSPGLVEESLPTKQFKEFSETNRQRANQHKAYRLTWLTEMAISGLSIIQVKPRGPLRVVATPAVILSSLGRSGPIEPTDLTEVRYGRLHETAAADDLRL
jgi:hypothetical protein